MLDLIRIGRILKSFGTSGQLKVALDDSILLDQNKNQFLFVDLEGSKVPFRISKLDHLSKDLLVSFSELNDMSDTHPFVNADIYLEKDKVVYNPDSGVKKSEFDKYVDFVIYLENQEYFGQVTEIIEYSQHVNFKVLTKEETVVIPFHQDFIISLDFDKKEMFLELPEGLKTL